MNNVKNIYLPCDDNAEIVIFSKYTWNDDMPDYEINIVDRYCDKKHSGIANRFKRAWHAFWAKPIYYSGICVQDQDRITQFFEDCLTLISTSNKSE